MSTSSNPPYHNVGEFYPRKFGPKPDVVPSGVTERKVMPLDKPDMVTLDVLNVIEAGLLCYNANANSTSHSQTYQFSTFRRLKHTFLLGSFSYMYAYKYKCRHSSGFYLLTAAVGDGLTDTFPHHLGNIDVTALNNFSILIPKIKHLVGGSLNMLHSALAFIAHCTCENEY